jgi:hypothetical protein
MNGRFSGSSTARKCFNVAIVAAALTALTTALQAQSVRRTIYVTARATDAGAPPTITAADVIVKEAGEGRSVIRVEPSRAPLQVAVVVEEILAPDNDVRRSVANFFDQVYQAGQIALYVVGRRSEQRIDYTSQIVPFASAINKFPVRGVEQGNLVQALKEIAREQRSREGRRAIVVLAVEAAQPSTVSAEGVLDELRAGSSVLYAATLPSWNTSTVPAGATSGGRRLDLEGQVSGLERDRVFAEGTRQSGGLHISSQRTAGMFAALERVASELNHQYVVSYDGSGASDGRLAVEAARPGLAVRGPTRAR